MLSQITHAHTLKVHYTSGKPLSSFDRPQGKNLSLDQVEIRVYLGGGALEAGGRGWSRTQEEALGVLVGGSGRNGCVYELECGYERAGLDLMHVGGGLHFARSRQH